MTGEIPDDTRGIVDPAAMMRVVDFTRYPAGDALAGLIQWFWSVAWALQPGVVHDQQVINHPLWPPAPRLVDWACSSMARHAPRTTPS